MPTTRRPRAVFVFTSSTPAVAVGDAVHVNARVQEFRPGGATNANLTTTELGGSPTFSVLSTGNPLPAAVVVGTGGRIPPNTVIEDDAPGNVETSGVFDPSSDGLDFWESLEGMRVQLNNPVAVGPTNTGFGETQVVGDNGANASVRTPRGGVLLRPTDWNPERVVLDDALASVPAVNVGDHYLGGVTGVLDYNFGNFFLEVTTSPVAVHDGVAPEFTARAERRRARRRDVQRREPRAERPAVEVRPPRGARRAQPRSARHRLGRGGAGQQRRDRQRRRRRRPDDREARRRDPGGRRPDVRLRARSTP